MIDDPDKRIQPQRPFPDFLMAVFVTFKWILAVIEVNGLQPLQPDHPVELLQHTVQIVNNIIPRIVHMTRIQQTPI